MMADMGDDVSLEQLLSDDDDGATPAPKNDATDTEIAKANEKIIAERLRNEREKIRNEERNAIAKAEGFDTYEDYAKNKERKLAERENLDPDAAIKLVDKVYEERRLNDPLYKELEAYRNDQAAKWAEEQAKELSAIIGEPVTIADIGQDVLQAVKPGGSIVEAYMAKHGRDLITKVRNAKAAEVSKGSSSHLQEHSSNPAPTDMRNLTPDEMKAAAAFAQYSGVSEDKLKNLQTKK